MPLFDYQCPKCGKTTEVRVPFAIPGVECMDCNVPMERQLPTSVAAHCYGAGIYKPSKKD